MTIINHHILKINDIYYNDNNFYIEENKISKNINRFIRKYKKLDNNLIIDNKNITIIDNLFIIESIHPCFCHALIDYTFPYFWAINDIKQKEENFKDFRVLIFIKETFNLYRKKIDEDNNKYRGAWDNMFKIITDKELLFEHLIEKEKVYFIKNCYFYKLNDNFQRSPWNCINYYPVRKINKNNVLFNDEIIKKNLNMFIKFYTSKLTKNNRVDDSNNNIIIINRRSKIRNINKYLPKLVNIAKKYDSFRGVVYLEDLTFEEQIKVFLNNRIIISPHGANLIHCIWSSNKTVIEITFKGPFNRLYKRICDISDNNIIQINKKFIVNKLRGVLDEIIK